MRSSSSSSSKHGAENNRAISGHMITLHKRLYHALNIGFRCCDDKGRKWHCTDIEMQRLVVRSIDAFLDCISSETSQHPLVKDSVVDIVGALEGILQFKNESIMRLASCVAVKMVSVLPCSILQPHILDLVHPLSSLLSSRQLQVPVSCATALSSILSNLTFKSERDVWEILKETNSVVNLVHNIKVFSGADKPIEYFQQMASLLSKILWRWPPSRFCVWADATLLEVLEALSLKPEYSVKVAVLQLYSSLALCGNGAKKLLENGETLLHMMMDSMDSSRPHFLRMEGFKLAQLLAMSEQGSFKMVILCCEPLVKAIICGMSNLSLHSGKLAKDQMILVMEACRLTRIARWAGEHHSYFWKLGVGRVLIDLLLNNFHKIHQSQLNWSLKEQIVMAQEGLNANFLLVLRPYVWDILGWLAANCAQDFDPKMHGDELHINILIICACLAFVESIRSARQIFQNGISNVYGKESASRTVLMMIYSPCKYIGSQARLVLSEVLKPNGKEYIKYFLDTLNATSSGNKLGMPDTCQAVINLISLTCCLGLPQYRKRVTQAQGIETLLAFIRWWLSNPVHIKRLSMAPHWQNPFSERTCCWICGEDWEGEDMLLLFSLWGLAELIHHSGSSKTQEDLFGSQTDYSEAQFVSELQEICSNADTPGPRWYAANILSYFGLYGFPSKLGKRIGKALSENGYTDLELILTSQESVSVHGVILMVRCPSLLPPLKKKPSGASFVSQDTETCKNFITEVHLSAHVDKTGLLKVLEFVYLGYLQAGEDLMKKLKIFARHCNLQSLLQMLCRRRPKWGTPIPSFDLSAALGPAGHRFSYGFFLHSLYRAF
ncbi:unnamed protein product [Ilex paraguariensis]|uniref:At1g04390 ARM repeat domain-containing protein n=1 Tax=Ilex paraguariensis TaxID=185542 RepID=A0ABC8SSW9_9AQUA